MSDCPCDCDLSGSTCDISSSQCPCDLSGCVCQPDSTLIASNEAQALVESTWGLRLRNRISQLGEDLSGNLRVLHPLIRPPSFEDLAKYKPATETLNEVYFQSMLCLLRFLTLSGNFLHGVYVVLSNIVRGIKISLKEQMYVFFEGSSYPYRLEDVKLDQPAVPPIEWYYNATTNTFITARLYANSTTYQTHHIPYLTAEVKYNELTLYDISEFINSIRWAGEDGEPMPNVDHLVSAWSLSTGIVLKRSPDMALSVINTDGNDVRVPLRSEA